MLEAVERLAVLFNVLYVILAWYQLRACWIFGMLGSALSIYYFQHPELRLYSEAGLYSFYVVMAIYGWYVWSRPDKRQITEWKLDQHLRWILLAAVATYVLYFLTSNYTDAARPLADSFTTVFGVLATVMTIRKILSNWIYWIVIDAFSIWLYLQRESDFYAGQMVLYTILAIVGWWHWNKEYRQLQTG